MKTIHWRVVLQENFIETGYADPAPDGEVGLYTGAQQVAKFSRESFAEFVSMIEELFDVSEALDVVRQKERKAFAKKITKAYESKRKKKP